MKNRKAHMTAVGRIELADCPMPGGGRGRGIVRMEYCGICGSTRILQGGPHREKGAPLPFIPGHEVSGYVTECGADVTALCSPAIVWRSSRAYPVASASFA